jgi:hypothetical protein
MEAHNKCEGRKESTSSSKCSSWLKLREFADLVPAWLAAKHMEIICTSEAFLQGDGEPTSPSNWHVQDKLQSPETRITICVFSSDNNRDQILQYTGSTHCLLFA